MSIYLNNEHLQHSDHVHICVLSDVHMYTVILIIDGVKIVDSGTLTFVAMNDAGTSSAKVSLDVRREFIGTVAGCSIKYSSSY